MGYVQGKAIQAAMGQGGGHLHRQGQELSLHPQQKILSWVQPEGQGPSGTVLRPLELCLTASRGSPLPHLHCHKLLPNPSPVSQELLS